MQDNSILKISNIVNISVSNVIKKDNKFLLVKEKDGYNFPSGKVNANENPIHAAIRETIEESGIESSITNIISIYYYKSKKNSYNKKLDRITVRINFYGKYLSENAANITEHEIQQEWMTEDEIESLIKEHKFRNWIAESLAKEVLSHKILPLNALLIK